MIAAGSIEYAFSRMQGRLSHRPSEGTWAVIEEARTLAPILDAAHGTTLESLLQNLPPQPDLNAADLAARKAWSRTLGEAAAWMAPAWAQAVAWCEAPCSPHPTLLPALGHPDWRQTWPRRANERALEELARLVARHRARFRLAMPHEAVALCRGFEARLLAFFRRRPVQAAAAFAWLALAALDLERLRGEIERRIAFPEARIAA